jgi:hypothetical protein
MAIMNARQEMMETLMAVKSRYDGSLLRKD